jgi:hypothetical protein
MWVLAGRRRTRHRLVARGCEDQYRGSDRRSNSPDP